MGFRKTANAAIVHPAINWQGWEDIRQQAIGTDKFSSRAASQVVLKEYDPNSYLLTHCSIIASVDTETPVGAQLGRQIINGQAIDIRYPDYYITPASSKYINNNCFVPGTAILMRDGTEKPIEEVRVGDLVISHTGETRRVVETFVNPFKGELRSIQGKGFQEDRRLYVTAEHPFFAAVEVPGAKRFNLSEPEWVPAGSLTSRHYLYTPGIPSGEPSWLGTHVPRIPAYTVHEVFENVAHPYDGLVYNFETEVDHSYVANGVAVHNCDAWERKLLLSSFRTFIGGENYVEHVQIPELSKGKIIDAAARDIGDSIYVDILVATAKKHKPLVTAITNGQLSTLSMGCFLPGTLVTIEGGRQVPIEEVTPGSRVLTHRGRYREVLNMQIRGGLWDVREVFVEGSTQPIVATRNHPFFVWVDDQQVEVRADRLKPGDLLCRPLENGPSLPAMVRSVDAARYEGFVHDMEVEEDHSYVVEGVAVHNCNVQFTICSKCGNVAEDEIHLCPHIQYEKGNYFLDPFGVKRKIAELCGHVSAEPGSVKFIEASWVANPAFLGAVLRNVIDPKTAEADHIIRNRIQVAFSTPTPVDDPTALRKAAARVVSKFARPVLSGNHLEAPPGHPSIGALRIPRPHATRASLNFRRAMRQVDIAAQQDPESFSFDPGPEAPAPEKSVSPLEKVKDDLHDQLVEDVADRVRKDIGEAEGDRLRSDIDENASNQSLIKSAWMDEAWRRVASRVSQNDEARGKKLVAGLVLYGAGGWGRIARSRLFSGVDILAIARALERMTKKSSSAGDSKICRTIVATGGPTKYANDRDYLMACRKVVGRDLTERETIQLLYQGRLFGLGR